jgi:hypothetical protein
VTQPNGTTPDEGQRPADGGAANEKQFEPIDTQEALDKIIGQRLGRQQVQHDRDIAAVQTKLDEALSQINTKTGEGDDATAAAIADMQAKLDAEIQARTEADAKVAAAELALLRTDRASTKGLPAALAKKLTGTTAEEIDAEIDELLPLLGPAGPQPNPQQGNPSQGRGGSLSAGRERYAELHPTK